MIPRAQHTKLMLRLEKEERARVKAQEQLAQLQAENIRLRGQERQRKLTSSSSSCESDMPTGVDLDSVGRALESYKRETALLKASLHERDAREAELEERMRQMKLEHERAQEEWEVQIANAICELQDLEAKNCELTSALRTALISSASTASTTASTPCGIATSSCFESSLSESLAVEARRKSLQTVSGFGGGSGKPCMDEATLNGLQSTPTKEGSEASMEMEIEILKRRNRGMAEDMHKLMHFVEQVVGIPEALQQKVMGEMEGGTSLKLEIPKDMEVNISKGREDVALQGDSQIHGGGLCRREKKDRVNESFLSDFQEASNIDLEGLA